MKSMKSMKLFKSMNDIDEKIIEEAESKQLHRKSKVPYMWKILLPVAACIMIVIMTFPEQATPNVKTPHVETAKPHNISNLPKLSIDTKYFYGGGMGFEGHLAYDVNELVNENPWNEDLQVSSLPVFKNISNYYTSEEKYNSNIEAMKERAKEVAALLGINLKSAEITCDFPSSETIENKIKELEAAGEELPVEFFMAYNVYIKSKNIIIEVDYDFTTTISFDPGISVPKKYSATTYASYDDTYKAAKYLGKKYKKLLQMEGPTINVYGGDYTINAEQGFGIDFFDNNGGLEEQIINYNFNHVNFALDDVGKLFIIRIYRPNLSEKVGEYPIIKPEQAKKLLIEGKYLTTVPEPFPGVEYVKKVELVYRNGFEKFFMPYYRFYIEIPSMKMDHNLNNYGAYYVPAIDGKYIENMPLWDGSFN